MLATERWEEALIPFRISTRVTGNFIRYGRLMSPPFRRSGSKARFQASIDGLKSIGRIRKEGNSILSTIPEESESGIGKLSFPHPG